MDHRYLLFKQIARGGMAEIYLGKQIGEDGFQRICCIKRILPSYAQEEEFVKMFRDEAHICKRLQHGNIVRVEGFEAVEGSYAIIMEFVIGSDLRAMLVKCEQKKVPLPIPCALYIAAEAARGLHYAHTKVDDITGMPMHIIHRDVSPQNVIISFEGEVKVTDFGIADANNRATETQPGIIKGKYAYMSPEQISAGAIDARTDIFALSIILWEMLTMRRLFQGANEMETIQQVKTCSIPLDIRSFNPEVTQELADLLLKGLSKDPKDRYSSAQGFEKSLRHYIHSHYPDFTPEDLSHFMQDLMPERKAILQTQLRDLLKDTPMPAGGEAPFQVTLATAHPGGQEKAASPMRAEGTKTRKRKKVAPLLSSSSPPSFRFLLPWVGLVMLGSAVFGGGFYYRNLHANKEVPAKLGALTLVTTPATVQLKVDDQPIQGGHYIATPFEIPALAFGPHRIEIIRPGYQTDTEQVVITEVSEKKEVALQEKKSMAPLRVRLTSATQDVFYMILDWGLETAALSPQHYLDIAGITFGEKHHLEVYSDPQKLHQLVACEFTPRAQSWQAPFVVDVDVGQQKCTYPLY